MVFLFYFSSLFVIRFVFLAYSILELPSSLSEYSRNFGSDEAIFYNTSLTPVVPLKARLLSFLFNTSEHFDPSWQIFVFACLKLILSFFLVWLIVILLSRIGYTGLSVFLISTFLILDPFIMKISFTMLRDDLITYSFVAFVLSVLYLYLFRFTFLGLSSLIISFGVLLTTRPLLGPLFLFSFFVCIFSSKLFKFSLSLRSLLMVLIFTPLIMFLSYELRYLLSLLNVGLLNAPDTFYRFFLSPNPFNLSTIFDGSSETDASYSPLWFLFRFFFNILLLSYILLKSSFLCRNRFLLTLSVSILLCIVFVSFFGPGALIHGPRQGYPFFATIYLVITPLIFRDSFYRINQFTDSQSMQT